MKKHESDQFSKKFYFENNLGDKLFPIMMKNRDTGKVAFRVSKYGNKKEDGVQVEEDEMVHKVLDEGYSVRMTTLDRKKPANLYSPNGHTIVRFVKLF